MAFCENFFETIDTPEKAYILGVVALNNTSDDPNDDLSVYIEINNVREIRETCETRETSRRILYDYYLDLGEEEKKKYPYFNNIDTLVECLRKIGDVSIEADTSDMRCVIELTITSQKIKDDIASHLDIKGCQYSDLTEFITKCYITDANTCNQFVKAYIEKYGCIRNDTMNITFYNEKLADSFVKLYDIPYTRPTGLSIHVIQYNSVNMIDLLGMIYSNYECPYYNNHISAYSGGDRIPIIKVFKVDDDAVMPSKARYSDAGYDLTIIREYRRLTPDTALYDTGIQLEIPNGYYVEIVPRSSMSRSGYILANSVGIIDQGYRGNLYIALTKINDTSPDLLTEWRLPWKCCQMIVRKQVYSRLVAGKESEKSSSEKSSRDTGAFGSTDKAS
jgi:deoxyuridine 5'-triphosphate nucleotidohydrolase